MTDYWDEVDDLDEALNKICAAWDKPAATQADIERILLDLPVLSESRVLEVGCGVGRLILPMRKRFRIVDGIDFSQKMVDLAKDYCRSRNNGTIWRNNGSIIPLPDSSYDFVFAFTVFQHIRSVEVLVSYLREMNRVLRSGGIVRFQLHEVNEQFGRWEEDLTTVWGNAYTAEEIKGLTQAAGFRDVEVIEEKPWIWIDGKKP